jgi:hypothetical protein
MSRSNSDDLEVNRKMFSLGIRGPHKNRGRGFEWEFTAHTEDSQCSFCGTFMSRHEITYIGSGWLFCYDCRHRLPFGQEGDCK